MSHWISARVVPGVVLGATALLLAGMLTSCTANYFGCGISRLDDEVKAGDLDGRYVGSEYGTLRLLPGGKLSFGDWRHFDAFSDLDGESIDIPPGVGRWEFARTESADELAIHLSVPNSVSEDGEVTYELRADGSADDPTLYQILGDPDACDLNTLKRK